MSHSTVERRNYDIETGTPYNRRVLADLSGMDTLPDGATVDAEGYVWSALIRSSTIARFDPTGCVVQQIRMPILYPMNDAFGEGSRGALRHLDFTQHALCQRTRRRRWAFCIEGLSWTLANFGPEAAKREVG
jgi:sugar lactone lactonase YvrE